MRSHVSRNITAGSMPISGAALLRLARALTMTLGACSESSKQLNDQRLKVLAAKQRLIRDVFEQAKGQIKKQVKGSGYAEMLATLLCQV